MILQLERQVLRALCVSALPFERRTEVVKALATHRWQSPDHQVIYEALRRSRHRDARSLREHLRAEATRLGFPDIDWACYFQASAAVDEHVENLVRTLLSHAAETTDPT